MSLTKEIAKWDGRSAEDIRAIHATYAGSADYLSSLVTLISSNHLVHGATWLLKAALESGAAISASETDEIYDHLDNLTDWQEQLHVLQCFEFLPISDKQKENVDGFLRACLMSDVKFVRAWAYHGFYYLAKQHAEYQSEVSEFFELALRDEAPSVKARVRQLIKKGFK